MTVKLRLQSIIKWLTTSVWAFPVVLFVILASLTLLKIHGSSIGIYQSFLYGVQDKDPDLIFGSPKPIRSDEWRASTPLTAFQVQAGFPAFNETMSGSGRDVTFSQDAPVKDWVGIFRPHNLSFFVMPLEYAFAFRWWLVMFLLAVAAYFFILRVLPEKKLLAIILSLAFALSPYLLWWYQSAAFLTFAYAFLVMIMGMRVIKQEKIPKIKSKRVTNLLYAAALSYIGISFGLLIYAPFIIPAGIVVTAFLFGFLLDNRGKKRLPLMHYAKLLLPFWIALAVIGLAAAAYAVGHRDVIDRFDNSEYPGQRVVESGKLAYSPALPILGSFLMPLLQSGTRAINYYANQSEASNYILLLPFLIVPGIFLQITAYRKTRKINYTFLFMQLLAISFWVRIALPIGDELYRLLFLHRVPNTRLLAGIGFVGFLQLLYFIRLVAEHKVNQRRWQLMSLGYGLACFGVLMVFGLDIMDKYPLFLDKFVLLAGFAALFTSIIVAFVMNKQLVGAVLLLIFTVGSSFHILPLYRGMDFFTNSEVINRMRSVSRPDDKWVVLDSLVLETLPWIAGRGSVGGPQTYPDLGFWRQINADPKYEHVYNRQAHALFLSNSLKPDPKAALNTATVSEDFELLKSNMFKVKFACSDFTYKNIDYVLVERSLDRECLKLVDKVVYPERTFFIYRVAPPAQS